MESEIFEVEIADVYNYRLSYGGQSAFFHGLEAGKLIGSKCAGCGFVWLPLRPICSKCYSETHLFESRGEGEVLIGLKLPSPPPSLSHLKLPAGCVLVKLDDVDACMKALMVSEAGNFAKGTRVKAAFKRNVETIADFHFVPL